MSQGPLQIRQAMPHGYPMLLVDESQPGVNKDHAVGFKNITFNEPCFEGTDDVQRPEQLAYPLSLLVESFGQGAGCLLSQRGFLSGAHADAAVVFGEFRGIEILSDAYPGERLRHELQLLECRGPLAILSGATFVGERPIARYGRMVALRVPVKDPAPCITR